MIRVVEYFAEKDSGDTIDTRKGVIGNSPTGYRFTIGVDSNGYKYAYATSSSCGEYLAGWGDTCYEYYANIDDSSQFIEGIVKVKINGDAPTTSPHAIFWEHAAKGTSTTILLDFLVYQEDSSNKISYKISIGTDYTSGVLKDGYDKTAIYTIRYRFFLDRVEIMLLENATEVINVTVNYSDFSPETFSTLGLGIVFFTATDWYSAGTNIYYYYWEFGQYSTDCEATSDNKLVIDGVAIPNATIYFMDNDSSSSDYQKVVGTAVTDADGSYTIPSSVTTPYIAFGVTPEGYGFCIKVDS